MEASNDFIKLLFEKSVHFQDIPREHIKAEAIPPESEMSWFENKPKHN